MHVYSLEAKQIIRAVVRDMRSGVVEVDCPDFAYLHNFVDANEYFLQETDIFDYLFGDEQFKKADAVAEEVTWWLQHTGTTLSERVASKPLI
jgi:hypothetical protein